MLRVFWFFGTGAAFPRCHCFRFHLGEASRPHTGFFCWVCFAVKPLHSVKLWTFSGLKGELKSSSFFPSLPPSFSTMGDIETPNSTGPQQTALLSVLPSKEFATSRKGMLLIAEVVRHDRRNGHLRIAKETVRKTRDPESKRALFEFFWR